MKNIYFRFKLCELSLSEVSMTFTMTSVGICLFQQALEIFGKTSRC